MIRYYIISGSDDRFIEVECKDVILPNSHGFTSKNWAVFIEHADGSASATTYTREQWKSMIDKGEIVLEQNLSRKATS